MIVVFLFDSDNKKYKGSYGYPIKKTILSTGILQHSGRHMKVSLGDVLIYSNAKNEREHYALCEAAYAHSSWNKTIKEKLEKTYLKSTAYAWVIQNITEEISTNLHEALLCDSAYLGTHGVDLSYPPHLFLYRNCMIEAYRIQGNKCNLFYSMGEEDSKDLCDFDDMKESGFKEVTWEDKGARKTIFDDYDTPEHFQQRQQFIEALKMAFESVDDTEELVMVLEDLNPKLFNVLAAAGRVLSNAKNEEDYAQVGLSCRRYIEQLADELYEARGTFYQGRSVKKDKIKNRIWAYIDQSLTRNFIGRDEKLKQIGTKVDELIDFFNRAIHGNQKEAVAEAFAELGKLTVTLLSLNPEVSRNPYRVYMENMIKLVTKA